MPFSRASVRARDKRRTGTVCPSRKAGTDRSVRMDPKGLTDSKSSNPLSTGKEDGGWKRIETAEDGVGPTKGDPLPKSISRMPQPRIITQRRGLANTTPINLHRKGIGRTLYPENAFYPVYVGMGQPQSQGVGQYFYAPAEGNLTKDSAFRSGLVLGTVGRSGGESAMLSEVGGREPQGTDSDLMVELGKDGYPRYDGDSNLARRPKTWRFKTKDRDVSMFPQRNQTSSPEAPSQFDIGNESLIYPLASLVLGRGKKSKDRQRQRRKEKREAAEMAKREAEEKSKAASTEATNAESTKKEDAGLKEGDVVRWSDHEIAINQNAPELKDARGIIVKVNEDGSFLVDWGDGKPAPALPKELVKSEGRYTEAPKAEAPKAEAPKAEAPKAEAPKAESPKKADVDLDKISDKILSFLSDDDLIDIGNRWLKMSQSERDEWLTNIQKGIPDESLDVLEEALDYIRSGGGGWVSERDKPSNKMGESSEYSTYARKPLPPDMTPQERLFRDIERWDDDYASYVGDDLSPAVRRVLEKKPEGNGKYFQWEYGAPSEGQEATLVIIRKAPWKEFQEAA